ncbi:MAG: hypothetical protein SF053_06560 [Bacteroidia bacterium]|nr:hypothetical protein [Bacteroidia bacterium]
MKTLQINTFRFLGRYGLLILLGVTGVSAMAQVEKPFQDTRRWLMVSTTQTDVYYTGDHEAEAQQVARYADLARFEAGKLFDFKSQVRYQLVLVFQPEDLQTTNFDLQKPEPRSGLFYSPQQVAFVVHPGHQPGLYEEVKRAVTRLILREFTSESTLGSQLQAHLLLYEAPWFYEGLADYVATGWTYEDEAWIASLNRTDLAALAQEGDAPINRVVRKSVWHYITHEHGESKLIEILYLVTINHSIESGIISVLGITLPTLTTRWREYMTRRMYQQNKDRLGPDAWQDAIQIPLRAGQRITQAVWSKSSQQVALYIDQQGQQQVYVYDLTSHKLMPLPIVSGLAREDAHMLDVHQALAIHPDGQLLVASRWERQRTVLAYYDFGTGELTEQKLPANIDRVMALAWSHDGKSIAVSALSNGYARLYLTHPGQADLELLTTPDADVLDPAWSLDDQSLIYAANPAPTTGDLPIPAYKRTFDLYRLELSSGTSTPLTETPLIQERIPSAISSFEVAFLTDVSGIPNVSKLNLFTRAQFPVSDLAGGILHLQAYETQALAVVPKGGEQNLYLVLWQTLDIHPAPEPTLLRLERNASAQAQRPLPARPVLPAAPAASPAPDTAAKVQTPVRFYIFDEESEPYDVKKPARRDEPVASDNRMIQTVFGQQSAPVLSEIEVSEGKTAVSPWQNQYIGLGLVYDPVAKISARLDMGFQDLLRRHQLDLTIVPAFNFRNSQSNIRYSYLPHRVDFFAEGGHTSRRIRENVLFQGDTATIFRFDQLRLYTGARYPINTHLALEGGIGARYIDRKDQRLRRNDLENAREYLAGAYVTLTYRNVKHTDGFRYAGTEARVNVSSHYSLSRSMPAFHRASADIRHYQQVYQRIVLATRLGASVTLPRQNTQVYMGGVDALLHRPIIFQNSEDNFIRPVITDTSLYGIHFLEYVAPVRGFRQAARDGSRYVVANLELRIPVSRLSTRSLPGKAVYALEVVPFLDAGTVWEEGNPFSQKKPTDTQFITNGPITVKLQTLKSPFLIGFGSGLRLNMLGWSLRTDLAWGIDDYTVQRPVFTTALARSF